MRIYRTATERIQSNQESKYIQAKHISAQSNVAAALTRQAAILEAGKIACENAKSMSERILEGKRAARNMRTEIQTSVVEFSQPVLDKLNETLKNKTGEDSNTNVDNNQDKTQKNEGMDNGPEQISSSAENTEHENSNVENNTDSTEDSTPTAAGQQINIII